MFPLPVQGVRTFSQPPDCSKNRHTVCPVLARLEPGLRPRQIQDSESSGVTVSHHLPAWGSIPVSAQLSSTHSTCISGAPFTRQPCARYRCHLALGGLTSSLCPQGPQLIHCVVKSRAVQGTAVQRGAGSTKWRIQDEVGFASFIAQGISAPTLQGDRLGLQWGWGSAPRLEK